MIQYDTGECGNTYGRLIVLRLDESCHSRGSYWWCECSCGNIISVRGSSLRSGHSKSCGCLKSELAAVSAKVRFTVDGPTAWKTWFSEYRSWIEMRVRCNNPQNKAFRRYGGRGISVCSEWSSSFSAFLDFMGPKPKPAKLFSIDRINNDGNYEPGNCHWATRKQQANNRCDNIARRSA